MSLFEGIKKAFKMPETHYEKTRREMAERHQKTEAEIKAGEAKRAEAMEQKRVEAEEKAIKQAQKDLKELPGKISLLGSQIEERKASATRNRERAYSAQPHFHGAEQGSFQQKELLQAKRDLEQMAALDDRNVGLLGEEKLRLELKLREAESLLESRGLLENK